MSGFRLLGMLTGRRLNEEEFFDEVNSDYLKVLNEYTYYSFCNSFTFSDTADGKCLYSELKELKEFIESGIKSEKK